MNNSSDLVSGFFAQCLAFLVVGGLFLVAVAIRIGFFVGIVWLAWLGISNYSETGWFW